MSCHWLSFACLFLRMFAESVCLCFSSGCAQLYFIVNFLKVCLCKGEFQFKFLSFHGLDLLLRSPNLCIPFFLATDAVVVAQIFVLIFAFIHCSSYSYVLFLSLSFSFHSHAKSLLSQFFFSIPVNKQKYQKHMSSVCLIAIEQLEYATTDWSIGMEFVQFQSIVCSA